MTLLGIDYGTKRVGVAVSDSDERFAMPLTILENDNHLVTRIIALVKQYEASAVVCGYSLDLTGRPNTIHTAAQRCATQLAEQVPVLWADERFSSVMAREMRTPNALPRSRKKPQSGPVDAHAAAIILQQFLDCRV